MATVILTVPHALCRDEDDKIKHLCDVVAERVARRLFDLLTDKGHRVLLRIADINREEVDLNRPEGRPTTFRRKLAEDFPRADFLLDVHSYPMRRDSWNEDIVLLKWVSGDLDNRQNVIDLLARLARTDLDVAVTHAAKENDITQHAMENGLPAILAEFSERAVSENEKRVVEKFAEAFDGFLQGLPKRVVENGLGALLGAMTKTVLSENLLCERTFHAELNIDIPARVLDVLRAIREAGGKGILIGGSVRDAILGKVGKDIDIEVYGLPGDTLFDLLGRFGKVNAVGKSFGVYKLRVDSTDIDFSLPRKERKVSTGHRGFHVDVDHTLGYVDAAKRRDFTINTLGYDPLEKLVYDPHGGMDDLKKGVIRMTDPAAFRDDPLRVLRMAQFSARFGFEIDPETIDHARRAPELETLPMERNFEEFRKALLRSKKPGAFIRALHKAHVVDRMFPEMRGHEDKIADFVDKAAEQRTGNVDDDLVLMLAAIGVNLSASASDVLLRRLTNEIGILRRVQNAHMSLGRLPDVTADEETVRRWLSKVDHGNLRVVEALVRASLGEKAQALIDRMERLVGSIEPIVMGRHLMDIGVKPGPLMGQMLQKLYDLQLRGEFDDLESGLVKAKELLAKGVGESSSLKVEQRNMRKLDVLLEELRVTMHESPEREVIVVDVDGTLVDVSERASAAFHEIGMKVKPQDWEDVYEELDPAEKNRFLRRFLSDKYASLDKPHKAVVSFVKRLYDRTELPVVLLTGRPEEMQDTHKNVAQILMQAGVPVSDVIQRREELKFMRSHTYKVKMLKEKGFIPRIAVDDMEYILDAFASEWPDAELYLAREGSIRKYKAREKVEK